MWLRKFANAKMGLRGGAIATFVMTVFRVPISQSPPPPAWFWSKYVTGGRPEDNTIPGLILHFLYGIVGGGVFGILVGGLLNGRDIDRERFGSVLGVTYGLLLSIFGTVVVLDRLLDMDMDADERFIFHLSHLVYGLTLGVWFGSRQDA
jgi:hypothetical protein